MRFAHCMGLDNPLLLFISIQQTLCWSNWSSPVNFNISGYVGNQNVGCSNRPGICPDGTKCDENADCIKPLGKYFVFYILGF